jgi:DNA-binding NarL/FixJ family response regulator
LGKLVKKSSPFTKREMDIIILICMQYETREIAGKLGIGKRTVESYRSAILKKMKVRNTAGVIVYAIRKGIFKIAVR